MAVPVDRRTRVVLCPPSGADRKLSPSQRRIVLALHRAGRPMTLRELAAELGIRSLNTAWWQVYQLRLSGLVEPAPFARSGCRLAPDVVVGSGGFIGRVVRWQWETTNHQRPVFPSATASALTPR